MDDGGVKSVLPDGHSSSAACAAEGFTATLTVDLRGVEGDEALYEAGPLRLGLRMAGETAGLEKYDRDAGNYLAFAMPDGRCPVLEATLEGLRVGIPLGFLERTEFTDRWHTVNVRIGGLRCVGGAYEVRMVVWYDRKAGATIFDAEIGGERTIICRRAGRFQVNGEHANDNQKANK
jgi:hypothetical protein